MISIDEADAEGEILCLVYARSVRADKAPSEVIQAEAENLHTKNQLQYSPQEHQHYFWGGSTFQYLRTLAVSLLHDAFTNTMTLG